MRIGSLSEIVMEGASCVSHFVYFADGGDEMTVDDLLAKESVSNDKCFNAQGEYMHVVAVCW